MVKEERVRRHANSIEIKRVGRLHSRITLNSLACYWQSDFFSFHVILFCETRQSKHPILSDEKLFNWVYVEKSARLHSLIHLPAEFALKKVFLLSIKLKRCLSSSQNTIVQNWNRKMKKFSKNVCRLIERIVIILLNHCVEKENTFQFLPGWNTVFISLICCLHKSSICITWNIVLKVLRRNWSHFHKVHFYLELFILDENFHKWRSIT